MDITETTTMKSDQQNYEDYTGGPKTVTVEDSKRGGEDQPVVIHLVEFPGRPFKPSKTVRRILLAAWGADTDVYVGRRMTLYGDPTIKWAGQAVGGIRISHLSHIDKPVTRMLMVAKGKYEKHTVEPLVETPPTPTVTPDQVAASTDRDELRGWWQSADATVRASIQARVAELDAEQVDDGPNFPKEQQ